ncbi:MAG: arginyltransferase [Arenicellales bacterium]
MSTAVRFPTLYISAPQECPYLPGEISSSLLLDPETKVSDQLFSVAIESGFRRSGMMVYRPHCSECKACRSVKIDVQNMKLSRNQKRTMKRNQDVRIEFTEAMFDVNHFKLYCRYQSWKHPGDSMDHGDKARYEESMVSSPVNTTMVEFYVEDRLVAVSVVDVVARGLSAVYTFFEPEEAKRSLGRFAVLALVERARELDLDFVYLGYWIKDCQKMSYKTEFQRLLSFNGSGWEDYESSDH